MFFFNFFQLQKDADELRKFLDLAERQKVKDILTIELRKVETEIIHKQEQEKGATSQEQPEQIAKPVTVTKTPTSHTPTTEIRSYGILTYTMYIALQELSVVLLFFFLL